MADYIIPTATGSITVPHAQRLGYKSMTLVGRDEENWNEPIQQNFVLLRDLLDTKLDKVFDQDLVAVNNGTRSLGTLAKQFKDLFLTNGVYVDGAKALHHVGDVITLNGKDGKTLRIQSLGAADVELGSTGGGKVVSLTDLLLAANKGIGTQDGSALKFLQGITVQGNVTATLFNGINLSTLAAKSELPDISGKADISIVPTKVSDLANDSGYLTEHQSLAAYATTSVVNSSIATSKSSILGGVAATHDTLAKIKSAYESAISQLTLTVTNNKSTADSNHSTLTTALNAEVNRAQSSESSISNAVVAETARAQEAEGNLSDAIDAEVARATGAESTLQAALASETTRAQTAESGLQTSINNEKTRAENAEGGLQTQINTEKTRAQDAELALQQDVDAINTLLQSDDLTLDSVQELVNAIKANKADLDLIDLSTKVTRGQRTTMMIGGNGIVIN